MAACRRAWEEAQARMERRARDSDGETVEAGENRHTRLCQQRRSGMDILAGNPQQSMTACGRSYSRTILTSIHWCWCGAFLRTIHDSVATNVGVSLARWSTR